MAISATSTQPREWNEGEQITSERLNSMIGYTEYVKNSASSAISNASQANTIANEAKTLAQTANTTANGQASRITTVENSISTISNGLDSMRRNLEAESTARSEADTTFNTYVAEIKAARDGETSLYTKIHNIDTRATTNTTNIGYINSALGDKDQLKKGYTDLVARLSNIDTAIVGNKTYTDQQITARTVTSVVTDEIKERLDRIDGGRVDTTSSVADYNHSIRLRNLEKEIIDDPLSGTTNIKSNVAALLTEINAAHTALNEQTDVTLANRFIAINTALQNAQNSINIIANELEMLDGGELTSLGTRIDNISDEITAAHRNVEEGQPTDTLVARFVAIENDVQAIAAELGVANVEAIQNTNTRIDEIESTITNSTTGLAATKAIADEALTTANAAATQTAVSAINTRLTTVESDLNTASTGLKARVSSTESNITSLDARLDKIDGGSALSGSNTLASRVNALETTPKSATKVIETVTYNTDGIPTNIGETPSSDVDYLLKNGDKYYYWKYINNNWYQISSSGEGGNNSGYDYLTEAAYTAAPKRANTDYYVMKTDGTHHYRYVMIEDIESGEKVLTEIEIGQFVDTSKIKRYNISTSTGTVNDEEVTYLNLYQYNYEELNNDIDTERAPFTQIILPKGGGGGASSSTINKLTRIGDQTIQKITGSKILLRVFYSSYDSEGTESNSGDYVLRTGNTTISSGILNSGTSDADLTEGWKDNTPGYYQFDVTDYCNVGNTSFTLSVTVNGTTLGKSWTVNIIDLHLESTAPEVLLIPNTDSYDFPYVAFGALNKTLHVIVDDDTKHETTVSLSAVTSGRQGYVTIPAQTHGAHKVELYLEATVGGVLQYTDSIIREYIWYNDEVGTTILASPYNEQTITTQQYSTIEIPYQVYKKGVNSITVEYYLDDEVVPFDSVTLEDTNTGILSYLTTEKGAHTLKIKVDDIIISTSLDITDLEINVSPVSGAIIDFDPTMLTNSSANRLPSWTVGQNTYHLTASDNFNWSEDASGGGYKTEADGKAFVIKAGSYVDLDYPMFAGNSSDNILTHGAEMKIIFKTEAVRDANAIWFQNTGTLTEKTVGIQLGAHYGWLKTDKATDTTTSSAGSEYNVWAPGNSYAINDIVIYKDTIYKCIKLCEDHTGIIPGTSAAESYWTLLEGDNIPSDTTDIVAWATGTEYAKDDIISYNNAYYKCKKDIINEITTNPKDASNNWLSMGKIDTEVLATNSYLYFPYSEEDKIELDININQYNANADTNFIMSYEDGVPSKAYAYEYGTAGDGLYHNNTIRIGSNNCDVYIYRLRIYNKSLKTEDILQNFIADGNGISEKKNRYDRNCIYWDSTQGRYFTSPSPTAILDPIKLAEVMPDVKILMLDTPVFTTGKKNFVQGTSLRCIHADGGNIYTSRGDADNWLFTNGFHSGQGTTSDNYGQSARNVDFLFEVDGVNYPTKKKNMSGYTPSENYVSKVYIGKEASTWNGTTWEPAREAEENEICDNWKGDKCKVALTETSVPNNYFNLKVNVASSENVNNALFQKRYDDFLIYNSPAQTAQITKHRAAYAALGLNPNDIKVKNSMEFVPAVLFVRENEQDLTKHNEFNDTDWHFYALGNIGDSKKTDYTRAYDPDDMNEFTCENSDNNTNNGQFQSGVFMYQGNRAIETPYTAYDSEETYEEGSIVVDNGTIKVYDGNVWTNATLSNWTDASTPYFAPYTAPNPMQYLFPITPSEWNVQVNGEYVNYKHNTLVNEEFDGDHSFEFRYACRGDYRDGDLINETAGQDDDAQFDLNHGVMLAFYEWLITATEEQYRTEASQWFVKGAMEFFYAYTHYYTMMDNRAKNTFWHFAKTGTYIEVSRPVGALLHVYEESTDNGETWVPATGTEIDSNKKYRTQYAFDLWAYDMDTAAGIDNNGAQVFPYGKEDGDYRVEGDASSGYAFNGAGSIFWRRLKTTFTSEIVEVMSSTDRNCFNSEDLINEFDTFQSCYPEEIWRLDIERKYIRTFTGASIDNSITTGKQNPRFLTSMMQGRKKYQRRQWIRDQGVYFNSKYRLSDITDNSNTIEFNCTTPADIENVAVTPSYYLQLVPYQDMYLNVQVGNGNYQDSYVTTDGSKSLRAKAGQTYTFALGISGKLSVQETRIYINGANHLSAIGNLAPMYPYSFDLRALAHIKTLDIGTDVSEYTNTKFTELKLPTFMPLLENLNIKNCHSIAGTIALSTASNIRTVEAMGTAITGISLPDYTSIQSLHIPSTVTAISLYGARQLTDFKVYNSAGVNDYSSLYKLHIYDSDYSSTVDWMSVATAMLNKQSLESEISLLKLSTASIGNIQTLQPFSEFKPTLESAGGVLDFSGTIHVTGSWSTVEKQQYETVWPNLELDTTSGTQQIKHKVTYKYDDYYDSDGNLVVAQTIKQIYINDGDPVIDIWQYTDSNNNIVHMLDEMPSRASTVRNNFSFGLREYNNYIELSGWKMEGASEPISSLSNTPLVRDNLTIETYFYTTPRTYYVNWYLKSGTDKAASLVKTSGNPVEYGQGYDLEAPTIQEIHNKGLETAAVSFNGNTVTYSIFNGWEKLPTNINPSATDETYDIYANWYTNTTTLDALFTDTTNLTPEQLLVLSAMSNTQKNLYTNNKISVGSKTTYTLGHDSIKEGTMIVGPGATESILRLDFTTVRPRPTSVAPLMSGNDAFTLMIDYCFNANATYTAGAGAAALVSCYEQNSSANTVSGFALYYNLNSNLGSLGPRVGFGDMFRVSGQSVAVGDTTNANARNVVILRHPKGSSTLYVYSGLNSGTTNSEINVNQLTWNNTTANAVINLGQLTNDTSDEYTNIKRTVVNGSGTIYQIKYWNEDLGIGECKRLAAWPHEDIIYMLSYLNTNSTQGTRINPSETAINLTSITNSTHGNIIVSTDSSSATVGWGTSAMRTFYNNRIYRALPTQLQAIICKPSVAYKNAKMTVENGINTYRLEDVINSTRDYVYAPSIINIQSDNDYINEDIAGKRPYQWLSTSSDVEVYRYNSTASNSWEIGTPSAQYKNLRFPYIAINWSQSNPLRIFDTSSVSVSNLYNEVNKIDGYIKVGDVCLVQDGIAYIYVNTELITQNGAQAMPNSGIFETPNGNGGWIKAEGTPLRSVSVSGSFRTRFGYITPIGTTDMSVTSSGSVSLGFNYEFAI